MWALKVATLLSLLTVVYQDFKYRGVYWICFPLLAVFLGTIKMVSEGLYLFWTDGLLAISFLLLQLFCLWCYFAIKEKQLVNITKGYIGWGDILFLIVMCFYLSPVNYIVFYVFSLITAIFFALTTKLLANKKTLTIPLAGIQALLIIMFLIADWFIGFKTITLLLSVATTYDLEKFIFNFFKKF